jgi:Zn ribbon nucleic-acid-binding protein
MSREKEACGTCLGTGRFGPGPCPVCNAADRDYGGVIQFECPTCGARHQRGFLNGVDIFRCLRCGYVGHGHHTDPEIDRQVQAELVETNEWNRAHGIREVPQGVDPLNGPG